MLTLAERRASPVRVITDLVRDPDLKLTVEMAAGIVGNLIGESGLISGRQEGGDINRAYPIAGYKGGIDWSQSTGQDAKRGGRRALFGEWVRATGATYPSYDCSFAWLKHELLTTENKTLRQVHLTKDERAAAETFEHFFERSRDGERNWPKRVEYARHALALYRAAQAGIVQVPATPAPVPHPLPTTTTTQETKPVNTTSVLPEGYFKSAAFWGLVGTGVSQILALTGHAVPGVGAIIGDVGPQVAGVAGVAISGVGHVFLAKKAKAAGAASVPLPTPVLPEAPVVKPGLTENSSLADMVEGLPRVFERVDEVFKMVDAFRAKRAAAAPAAA